MAGTSTLSLITICYKITLNFTSTWSDVTVDRCWQMLSTAAVTEDCVRYQPVGAPLPYSRGGGRTVYRVQHLNKTKYLSGYSRTAGEGTSLNTGRGGTNISSATFLPLLTKFGHNSAINSSGQIFFSPAPFELFGRNFGHLATLLLAAGGGGVGIPFGSVLARSPFPPQHWKDDKTQIGSEAVGQKKKVLTRITTSDRIPYQQWWASILDLMYVADIRYWAFHPDIRYRRYNWIDYLLVRYRNALLAD